MSLILMTGSQMSSFKCQLSHSTVLGASSSLMISRDPGAKLKHDQGLPHCHDLPVISPSLFCCLTPRVPGSFPHRLAPLFLSGCSLPSVFHYWPPCLWSLGFWWPLLFLSCISLRGTSLKAPSIYPRAVLRNIPLFSLSSQNFTVSKVV